MFTDGISLFSGAGGDTIGLTNSGVNVIGYSEYIDTFIETHKANHPKCKLIGKDIRQIKNETFEEYKNKIGILFAGFPCFIKGTKVFRGVSSKNYPGAGHWQYAGLGTRHASSDVSCQRGSLERESDSA